MIGPAVCSTHGSGTVDVHLIPTPREDEVDHMPVSGTRMHPGGLAFIVFIDMVEVAIWLNLVKLTETKVAIDATAFAPVFV